MRCVFRVVEEQMFIYHCHLLTQNHVTSYFFIRESVSQAFLVLFDFGRCFFVHFLLLAGFDVDDTQPVTYRAELAKTGQGTTGVSAGGSATGGAGEAMQH